MIRTVGPTLIAGGPMTSFLKKVGLIAVVFVFALPAFPQGNTGRILGNISDPSGALIPGASITITDVERGTSRSLVTDEAGAYNAPSLPPGTYRIRAELQGFKTVERTNVVLEVGKELKIDIALEPGALNEKITVTEETPMIETA